MNKSILIKAGIVMGIFLTIIISAVGCNMLNPDPTVPTLSDGEDVYLTVDGFTITKQELYETMMNVNGLNFLFEYIDEIILDDFIQAVTSDEIEREYLLLTFGTDNENILTELEGSEDIYNDYVDAFNSKLEFLGYDSSDQDDVNKYLTLSVAKKNFAISKIEDSEYGSPYYIYDEELEAYYDATVKNDVCALELRFSSLNEAEAVFAEFDLVLNYNEGIGHYNDGATVPIEDVSSEEFTDVNTTQLTDDEVFAYYVEIYNYMNPYGTQLPTDLSQEDLCADYSDIATYNYTDMTTGLNVGSTLSYYATYLFDTIDLTDEDVVRFSYSPRTYGDSVILAYKVSQEVATPYDDISSDDKFMYRSEFIEGVLEEDLVKYAIQELRLENEFEIVEPYLALSYEFNFGIKDNTDGSETVVASLNGTEITADELFAATEARAGVFYSLEVVKIKMIFASDYYSDIYGSNADYFNDDNGSLEDYRVTLESIKATFNNGGYTSSGFSNTDWSWNDVLYLGFGVKDEASVIKQYIMEELQPDFVYPTIDYADFQDYLQLQIDEYYSLNATHLLLYLDLDKDFTPDDYSDFIEEIEADTVASDAYYALKAEYEALVNSKLNNDMTFTEIVTEYNETLMGDTESEWYDIKQYGFKLLTETLSSQGSLNYLNSANLDEAFQVALKEIYDEYSNPANVDLEHLLAASLTTSDFGVHLIDATKGTAFEMPTAEFTPSVDNPDAYSADANNENAMPTEAQIKLYVDYNYDLRTGNSPVVTLPGDAFYAIANYFDGVLEAYYNLTGYSIVAAEYILDSNPVYATDSVTKLEKINTIKDILYTANFPKEFVSPTE